MSLNQKRIDENTRFALSSLKNKKSTPINSLHIITNFFEQSYINRILEFANTCEKWQFHITMCRQQIDWIPDSIVEEIHIIFKNLTEQVIEFAGRPLDFNGINIWKDTENYRIPQHSDNPLIEVAIQIYLQGPRNSGTQFINNNSNFTIDFIPNTGYILDNSSKAPHLMPKTLPKDTVRFTVYATWKKATSL